MKLNEVTEVKASDLHQVRMYKSGALYITDQGLTSLEGCPDTISGTLTCSDNQLTSFEYFPKHIVKNCHISHNNFTSFKDIDKHIEYIGSILFAFDMNIASGFLDLFGIDGLQGIEVDIEKIQEIANRYLPSRDIINFQDEMIKSGFESYL